MVLGAAEFQRTGKKPDIPGLGDFSNLLNTGDGDAQSQMFMFATMFTKLIEDAKKTGVKYRFEIQRRIATPFGCPLFFFISFPLGLVVKRSGKGMGFTLALGVFSVNYVITLMATNQAFDGKLDPAVAAWLPNALLLGAGLYLMGRRTDGFQPFAFITRPVGRLLAWIWQPVQPHYTRWIGAPLARAWAWLGGTWLARAMRWLVERLRQALAALFAFALRLWHRLRPPAEIVGAGDHR